jgi:hypothetical protein
MVQIKNGKQIWHCYITRGTTLTIHFTVVIIMVDYYEYLHGSNTNLYLMKPQLQLFLPL